MTEEVEVSDSAPVDLKDGKSSPLLVLNQNFAKNIIKRVSDHNRIITGIQENQQRKFINEERKKHTLRNLNLKQSKRKVKRQSVFAEKQNKTMYSDYVSEKLAEKTQKKAITAFDQMKKLVTDAANFDNAMAEKEDKLLPLKQETVQQQRRSRISVDKRLLRNHLQV